MRIYCAFCACFLCMTLAGGEIIENWPRWRGPRDNGTSREGEYPVTFDANTNLAWKVALPGRGCSTPIIWEERIYLTAPVNKLDAVLAFDAHGKQLWQTTLGREKAGKHRNGSSCNPSPTTDGTGLFVYFKSGTLAAVELDGKVRWQTNLVERFGADGLFWDYGSSPVLTEKAVVISMARHGDSYLAAFDKRTGEILYKVPRNYKTPLEGDHSYATPLLIRHADSPALLVFAGEHLSAHDAFTGKEIWTCGNFNPAGKPNWVAVASPVLAGDVAIVPFGRGNRLDGIKLGGGGDVTSTHRLWTRDDSGAFCPTPAVHEGRAYVLRDRGQIDAIDPATGKSVWGGELPKHSGSYYASPLIAGGKLYAVREDGLVFVVQLGGAFSVVAENALGESVNASPVPLGSHILIRGEKNLFCAGK